VPRYGRSGDGLDTVELSFEFEIFIVIYFYFMITSSLSTALQPHIL